MAKNRKKIDEEIGDPSFQEEKGIEQSLREAVERGQEVDKEFLASVQNELLGLPQKHLKELIRNLVKEDQERALPVLISLAQSDKTGLAVAAVEGLGTLASTEYANALARIADESTNKDLRKEAKKSLFKLKSQGIVPEEAEKPVEARVFSLAPPVQVKQTFATSVDGTGSRAIWLAMEKPLRGMSVMVAIVNDLVGIKRVGVYDMNRKSFQDQMERVRAQEFLTLVELPIDYARQLMQEAYTKNQETGASVPSEFVLYKSAITLPAGAEFQRPIVYNEIDPDALESSPEFLNLLQQSPILLQERDFAGWFFEFEQVKGYALEYMEARHSKIILSPQARDENLAAIFGRAIEDLFDPATQVLYRRRLEEMAYVLLHTDRADKARLAVAAAIRIGGDLPPGHNPFLTALVQKSLAIAIDIHLGGAVPEELSLTLPEHAEEEPTIERRTPGGLYLP